MKKNSERKPIVNTSRKVSYRKDDRAMRHVDVLKIF